MDEDIFEQLEQDFEEDNDMFDYYDHNNDNFLDVDEVLYSMLK